MPKLAHGETSSSSKLDRKTIEKNRRIHMKSLCSNLFNLLPPSHFKIPKVDLSLSLNFLIIPVIYLKTNIWVMRYINVLDVHACIFYLFVLQELISQQNQICYVITYINELKERVKNLEKRKQALQLQTHSSHVHNQANNIVNDVTWPLIEINDLGNDIIHIVLISSLNRSFTLHQIISVIEEEGGQVVNASLSTIGNKVFHSLHIEAKISRIGIETSRVKRRLMNLVYQKQN
ncbi:transcription factor bHLH162-like [Cucumis sativus]|uniref:transcription factor bHLH162-like n=1 Tax=Cucumis sativus TaxID=3659 RepID=UPI0012F4FC61|nr:transcription factor bHLH162-like [Cucumis sativus]